MKHKVIVIFLIVIILQYFCTFVFAENAIANEVVNGITNETANVLTNEVANEVENLETQKEEVENRIEETNDTLEYVQEELSSTLMRVQEIEDKVIEYEEDILALGEQMTELQASIDDATAKLQIATMDYEEKKKILAERLVSMYEAGDVSYLDVLLKSKSLTDFISRYYVIEEMADYDQYLINQVKIEKENIETTRKKLENEQTEIKIVKARAEQTSIVLNNMRTMQQNYVNQLSEGEKTLQEQITAYKKEQAEIEAQILLATNRIDAELQFTGGEMLWPVAASGTYITSGYGVREHPIQGVVKEHTGIDIGNAPTGTPVVAAADGVVTYAGWLGGYGNCVMISHGNGVVTLYGHGNKVLTSVDTQVKQGDVIMELGSTGNSTGPHCHFEVRINGNYTNPLNFVKVP